MTPAQQRVMDELEGHHLIMLQIEKGKKYDGLQNGRLINWRTFMCLVRNGNIEPDSYDIIGEPMTYRAVN